MPPTLAVFVSEHIARNEECFLKYLIRFGLYFFGLFIISVGINLAILSNLGVSPVSAFTVPLSHAVHISLGCYVGNAVHGCGITQVELERDGFAHSTGKISQTVR